MDVGNGCAAKVSGEQNRAEHRSLPNGVERSANEKNYADRENGALGKSRNRMTRVLVIRPVQNAALGHRNGWSFGLHELSSQ